MIKSTELKFTSVQCVRVTLIVWTLTFVNWFMIHEGDAFPLDLLYHVCPNQTADQCLIKIKWNVWLLVMSNLVITSSSVQITCTIQHHLLDCPLSAAVHVESGKIKSHWAPLFTRPYVFAAVLQWLGQIDMSFQRCQMPSYHKFSALQYQQVFLQVHLDHSWRS